MRQRPLLMLTAVDLRRVSKPDESRANTVRTLTIPPIRLKTAASDPGGGMMETNYTLPRLELLEPAASHDGLDDSLLEAFGMKERWTMAGVYQDKDAFGGGEMAFRGNMEAVLNAWEPEESDPAEFNGCNLSFAEVTHLDLTLGGREILYVDKGERVARFMGRDLFAGHRRALGA